MLKGLIPLSIYNTNFNKSNVGYCTNNDIKRLYELREGVVFVPDNGNLKYIPLIRRTRLNLIPVTEPKEEFDYWCKEYKL